MTAAGRSPRLRRLLLAVLAVAILVPSMLGFANKFIELVHVYRGDPGGAFAIAPIVNYLLASIGFLFLLGWAALNGMFRDIEAPKRTMLENEARLDAAAGRQTTILLPRMKHDRR